MLLNKYKNMNEAINFVAIDFETATANAACQIGIAVVRKGEIVEEVCRYIQPPENKYSRKNIAIHHITPDVTKDAPTFDKLWPEIRKYFHCQLIVCHNASFDMSILSKEIYRYDLEWYKPMATVCTYELTGAKLEVACSDYGIEVDNHHNALSDAIACAKLFISYLTSEPNISGTISDEERQNESQVIESEYTFHEPIRKDLLVPDLENADKDSPFYNKKVVITGVFSIERNELAEFLKKEGADINTCISKRTNIVFVGDEPGPSKIDKLNDLLSEGYDIKIITREMLDKILLKSNE